MKQQFSIFILVALIATTSLFSCSDTESRMPLSGYATVVINLGLQPEYDTASLSIIDRVLRFFTRDAMAADAPAVFSNVNIRITGADIGSMAKDYPPTGIISLTVPAGRLRIFDVTAYVAGGDPSAAFFYRGSATANLPAGETVSVPVAMKISGDMKLVIPDYYGSRLVMMDSINGKNTIMRTATQVFGGARSLNPHDVDYDNRGRIYFSNPSATSSGGIYRMDTMDSTWTAGTCVQPVSDAEGVTSIAIDRKRNILYYVNNSEDLYRLNLDELTPELILASNVSTGLGIGAVCVDDATGMLYLSYVSGTLMSAPYIGRFDPINLTFIAPAYAPGAPAFDLTVKGGYLYASFTALAQIRRLPMNLDTVTTPPVILDMLPDDSDQIQGATMFLAVTNTKLFIIDEDPDDGLNNNERVLSFFNIDGSGWETTSLTTFQFYSVN